MKKTSKIILTTLFSIISIAVFAQKFHQFKPKKEPFKIFESPIIKFDTSYISINKSFFSSQDCQIFTRNNGMPILKMPENQDNMPIYKSDTNIKQSLIIDNPKGFEMPANTLKND